jgi:hypothetical protein
MPEVMFDRFELSIELGNDAMQGGPDVAEALREVADRIENGLEDPGCERKHGRRVRAKERLAL